MSADPPEAAPGGSDYPTRPPAYDAPGRWIGPYHLLQKAGEGGMGEVWLAEQVAPVRRRVAVKVIKLGMDTHQVVARFEAERQALALMDHPAIASVFDAGSAPQGRPYFVMEYVKGDPITEYCDRCRLKTRERLELFIRVCEGVQHAHQKGIIHRDLKASNVLVTVQDEHPVPKIIDFGVAKATTRHWVEQTVFTELGVMIGTPEYMSPEQADLTALDIDTRSDVYSLGVLLYELLTGRLPFDRKALQAKALDEMRRTIREVEPPRPSTRVTEIGPASAEAARSRQSDPRRLAGELRGDLDWITMKALEKDRTRRYGSASDLSADIVRHLAHHPVVAGPPGAAYRAQKFVRRHRFGVAAAVAAVIALVGFGAAMAVQAGRITRERDRAVAAEKTATEVSEFLVDLFRTSDPTRTRGGAVTAREILDRGAAEVRGLRGEPLLQANLMDTLGRVYDSLGLFEEAGPLLEASLASRRRLLGDDHPDVASSLVANSNLLFNRGEFAKAKPMLEQALAIYERKLGPDDLQVAGCLHNLGNILFASASLDEAERVLRRALEIREKLLPPDAPETATTVNSVGAVAYRKGDWAGARALWERTLAMRERTLGTEHAFVAQTLNNLAILRTQMGDWRGARPLLERVVAIQEKVLGPKHPDLASGLSNLADTLVPLGELEAASACYRRAVAILEEANRDHPEIGRFLVGLARTSLLSGDSVTARENCTRSLELRERTFGKDHPETAMSLVCLANCDRNEHQYEAAEALFDRALALLRRPDGSYNAGASLYLDDYAALLRDTGREPQATEVESIAAALRQPR